MSGLQRTASLRRSTPLKRGPAQLKRTGFKKPVMPQRQVRQRKSAMPVAVPVHARSRASYATIDDKARESPKTVELRNKALLELARGRPCLLRVPGTCSFHQETTVACHSNQSLHGKGGARKADDHYSVWGCYSCHTWLDAEGIAYEVKVAQFEAAMALQIEHWIVVATSLSEPEPNRRAARWALFQHGVPV